MGTVRAPSAQYIPLICTVLGDTERELETEWLDGDDVISQPNPRSLATLGLSSRTPFECRPLPPGWSKIISAWSYFAGRCFERSKTAGAFLSTWRASPRPMVGLSRGKKFPRGDLRAYRRISRL